MRKITLLLMLFATSLWQINAQFTQGFESGIDGGWTTINQGSANGWVQNTAPDGGAQEGTAVASILYDSNVAHDDYLITPAITVAAGTNDFLSFSVRSRSGTFLEPYEVLLSTTGTAAADFTVTLQASSNAPAAWTEVGVNLSAYNGQTVYVAIKATGTDEFELFVDNVVNGVAPVAPNCASNPTPADGATDIPNGAITLTWDAPTTGPTPTSYDLLAGSQPDGSDLSLVDNFTTNTAEVTVTGYDTTIYWRVVPKNGSAAATGCDLWSLTTGPQPPAPGNDLPAGAITLTLDEGTACGANAITGISNESTTDSGEGVPSCGSYTTGAAYGDLWYKFTAPSVSVTLNTENVAGLSSVAGAYYSGTPGSFTEEGCTQFASGWPWTLTGLTPGQEYYLRVWDFSNDNLGTFDLCGYYATCIVPTDLNANVTQSTEAEISWTAGGTETAWEYVVQEAGGTAPTTAGTATTSTTQTITQTSASVALTEGTQYEFYVRANCGGGDFSEWSSAFTWLQPGLGEACSNPISLNVEADCSTATPHVLDYSTAADLGTTDLSCDTFGTNTGQWFEFTAPASGGVTINTSDSNEILVIDACGGTNVVCISTAATSHDVSGLTGGATYYLAVWKDSATTGTSNICIEEVSCPSPSAGTAVAATTTTADLNWSAGGSETSWDIEIVDAGTAATGTATATGTSPYTATGLTEGNSYDFYVRANCVGSTSDWVGPFSWTQVLPPTNDDCANAIAITAFSNGDSQDASAATNNGGFLTVCNSMNDGVWYTFEVVDAGNITVEVSGVTGWDPELAVYSGSCGTFTCESSADSGGTGGDETVSFAATANTQYWVNVGHYSGFTDGSEGPLTINVSTTDTATLDAALSVDNNTIEGFRLYPNPAKDELHLNAQDTIEEVTIYNVLGQRVMNVKPNLLTTSLPLTELNTGMYIVKVKVGDQVGTYRIVKE